MFKRIEVLVGAAGLARLRQAHVTVVGLGAVGSFAMECLARSGIGHLRLIDFDVVDVSNINRQLIALPSTVGREKIQVAMERVHAINPACEVQAESMFVNQETLHRVVEDEPDVVIDAIDSLNSKVLLLRTLYERKIPVISALGAATRTDPSCVRVTDLSKTYNDRLARMIRKRLGRFGIRKGITCVFSCEKPNPAAVSSVTDLMDGEVRADLGFGRPRNVLGSFCAIPGIFGLTAAQEAINLLLLDLERAKNDEN